MGAREITEKRSCSYDYRSLGCTMVHMLSGQPKNLNASALPDSVSANVRNLVASMLEKDRSLRPTAQQALEIAMNSSANNDLFQEHRI